jgi:hypothetical protein
MELAHQISNGIATVSVTGHAMQNEKREPAPMMQKDRGIF